MQSMVSAAGDKSARPSRLGAEILHALRIGRQSSFAENCGHADMAQDGYSGTIRSPAAGDGECLEDTRGENDRAAVCRRREKPRHFGEFPDEKTDAPTEEP